ncbi:hypothetical protein CCMSSC00406_0008152 [Pleurotus cornucopiae]|uniref:Uncharacterized protein n=1 Tax=Pleurotus cornucopiae TaxID=5321 RepID=A0ACB7IPB1_PLECO|nr:hypothetical protein CCMSSC00406_0008152 [Pleurotus cornucopiae]
MHETTRERNWQTSGFRFCAMSNVEFAGIVTRSLSARWELDLHLASCRFLGMLLAFTLRRLGEVKCRHRGNWLKLRWALIFLRSSLNVQLRRFRMSETIIETGDGTEDTFQAAKLPVELIYLIIAVISDDNNPHETLAACSLVCRSWRDMCCVHFFANIVLNSENLAPRLSFLCHTAPHLSEYIHALSISWADHNCSTPDWNWDSRAVFKNLRTLRLCDGARSASGPSPAPLLSITAILLAAPCLKELTLRGMTFAKLPSVHFSLALCSNTLEQLTFDGVSFFDCSDNVASSPIRMGALRKLESPPTNHPFIECPNLESLIVEVGPGRVWALPSWVPSRLRDLTLHSTHHFSVMKWSYFAEAFGKLSCRKPPHPGPWKGYLSISLDAQLIQIPLMLEHLRHLTITLQGLITSAFTSYPENTDYDNLLEIIQRLREHSALVHINLEITIFLYHALPTDWAEVKAREVPKLKRGLDPLFEANVLRATFAVRRQTSDEELEILMDWEGGTAEWQ